MERRAEIAEEKENLEQARAAFEKEEGETIGRRAFARLLGLPEEAEFEDSDEKKVIMKREPLGVVGSITPWNFPLIIAIWHIVPGIRTGNTVVIKPSPFTPLSTLRLVQLMNEVLPPGLVNIISGGDEIGRAHV